MGVDSKEGTNGHGLEDGKASAASWDDGGDDHDAEEACSIMLFLNGCAHMVAARRNICV